MNEVAELERVADEKDRGVVADQIPIAVGGIELHRKAAGVADGIRRAFLAAHLRKADEHIRLLADGRKHPRPAVARYIVGNSEGAVSAGPFRVDHPLRDAFPVEVRHFFNQLEVLHQRWPTRPGGQRVLVVANRNPGGSR